MQASSKMNKDSMLTNSPSALRYCTFVFFVSRLFIFLLLVGATQFSATTRSFKNTTLTRAEISLLPNNIQHDLRQLFNLGDAGWYVKIAEQGYAKRTFDLSKQETWAFFPLFPLLMSTIASIFGLVTSGVLLANLAFFLALLLLYRIVEQELLSTTSAQNAVLLLAFSPMSFFFSSAFTESLFLLLSLSAFLHLKNNRTITAGVLLGFASATRVTTIALFPAFAWHLWQKKQLWRLGNFAALLFASTGILAFAFYLWQLTGNALAFVDIQSTWDRPGLVSALQNLNPSTKILHDWSFPALHVLYAAIAAAAIASFAHRKRWDLALFLCIPLLLNIFSGSLLSFSRHCAALFPLYIFLAQMAERPTARDALFMVNIVFFTIMLLLAGFQVTAGLT